MSLNQSTQRRPSPTSTASPSSPPPPPPWAQPTQTPSPNPLAAPLPHLSRAASFSSSHPTPTRPRPRLTHRRRRRRSSRSSPRHTSLTGQLRHLAHQLADHARRLLAWYLRLPLPTRLLLLLACLLLSALALLALLYTPTLFHRLGPVAEQWRRRLGPVLGRLVTFLTVFVTAFPPVIGYATASTVAGFVWGFPGAWPVVAAACTLGSLGAFVASRTVLGGVVERWAGRDPRFVALAQVMRAEGGLLYLTAVRFCPLPFSLSNGFLATIPSITPLAFTISTALSSVKLLIHVFIGSRLAFLSEKGDDMSLRDKAINWAAMAASGIVGLVVGLLIYRRTMERADLIAREQHHDSAVEAGTYADDDDDDANDDDDDDDPAAALLDPEDAAAIMSDDDLSMWGGDDDDDSNNNGSGGSRGGPRAISPVHPH